MAIAALALPFVPIAACFVPIAERIVAIIPFATIVSTCFAPTVVQKTLRCERANPVATRLVIRVARLSVTPVTSLFAPLAWIAIPVRAVTAPCAIRAT